MEPPSRNRRRGRTVFKSCEKLKEHRENEKSPMIDPENESSSESEGYFEEEKYNYDQTVELYEDNESSDEQLLSEPDSPSNYISFNQNITPREQPYINRSSNLLSSKLNKSVAKPGKNCLLSEGKTVSKQTTGATSNISVVNKKRKKKRKVQPLIPLPPINEK